MKLQSFSEKILASGLIFFSATATAQTVYEKAAVLFAGAAALDATGAGTAAGKAFSGSCVSQGSPNQTSASQIAITTLTDPILGPQFNAAANPWLDGPGSTFRLAPTTWKGQTSLGWKTAYYSSYYNYDFPIVCNLRKDAQGILVSQCAVSYCVYSRVDGGLPGDHRQYCAQAGWHMHYCWYSNPTTFQLHS